MDNESERVVTILADQDWKIEWTSVLKPGLRNPSNYHLGLRTGSQRGFLNYDDLRQYCEKNLHKLEVNLDYVITAIVAIPPGIENAWLSGIPVYSTRYAEKTVIEHFYDPPNIGPADHN